MSGRTRGIMASTMLTVAAATGAVAFSATPASAESGSGGPTVCYESDCEYTDG